VLLKYLFTVSSADTISIPDHFVGIYGGQVILEEPGSVVGIATGYRLDSPGIESRWGQDFPHLSRPALGPT